MTISWTFFLNRLDFGLKRVELCEGPSHADQINRLFSSRDFCLDNGSFSSPLLLSFKLQYPGPNRPTNVAVPNECEQYCEGRVYHGRTRCSARILRIGITRRNPASFNKAGPSRQISACCEEDHGLSIDKRAPTLKSLMRQFLTRKTVCKPAVRNVEVNKFQKRCPVRKPVQDRIPASTGAPDRIARGL